MTDNTENHIPTNEEIISELTTGLESHCIRADDNSQESKTDENNDKEESSDDTKNEDLDTESEKTKKSSDLDDFVDIEKLKDLEITISDDEKEELKIKSIELKNKGNEAFKKADYPESLRIYTEGLNLCPLKFSNERSILYGNRASSKAKLGRLKSAIEDCTESVELNDKYVRAFIKRAQLYEQTESLDEALQDYQKVIEIDPSIQDARQAIVKLTEQIQVRNEKMKEEMFGKLKDLGNLFLKPFGLSTENFKLNQDPSTGGYSVNFNQNK